MTTYTVAFIGLGAMGGQMVRHLIAAGHRLHVYARRPEAAAPYEALGAKRFETPAQAAADADFVITNVTTTQDVEDVLLGTDGVVHGARAGTICVDHSTISAEATRRMAARLARHEIQLVDAPVSGGPSRAADASLSIMVGAPDVVFARVRPLLSVLGSTITHVGDVGAGQVAKACNQIVQVINIQGIAEAMLFAARNGVVLMLGMLYFAAFANAIMFDVLLTTCALIAMHGIVDLIEDRGRGIVIAGLGIGLGILTKGPVMLLDVGFAALLAPWWNRGAPRGVARYYGALVAAIVLGAAIALAWAIPAALHGGPTYSRAIFLSQTLDRIQGVKTGTHSQPIWWYVVWLPMMLLPWPIALRGRWSDVKAAIAGRGVRLAIAWVVPTLIVFSLIGGKQAHYLLPLLPGVALGFAVLLDRDALRVRVGLASIVLIAVGLVIAWLPFYAATRPNLDLVATMSPAWGAAIAAIGVAMFIRARRIEDAIWPALATLGVVLLIKLAIVQGPGVRYDVRAIAEQVQAAQARGQPIVHLGWHHGVYEFAGRLTEPLPTLTLAELPAWVDAHPDGLVMSFYRRYRFRAEPVYSQPFRGVQVSIWNAREAVASGVDPNVSHARDDSEDASDED